MARRPIPTSANMYAFRDLDIMFRLAEAGNGGFASPELAEMLGFEAEGNGTRAVGVRLAWMKRLGMVAFDDTNRLWSLTKGGSRVVKAHELAPKLKLVESMPDEQMIDVMAHVTSRFQRGESMLGHMLRREFSYGTARR